MRVVGSRTQVGAKAGAQPASFWECSDCSADHSSPTLAVSWSTVPYSTNVNANAIRWGTTYNFRFDADQPPVAGTMTLGLFRPGSPASEGVPVMVPDTPVMPICPGDANGDNMVNFDDLNLVLENWATAGPDGDIAPVGSPDGAVNFDDLNVLLENWGNTCP